MPIETPQTKPWLGLLDPEKARREIEGSRASQALSLLREVLNQGTNVFGRCAEVQPQGPDEGVAPLRLFFHVLEMLDAIDVQLREGCVHASEIGLRSLWEATLELVFMLKLPKRREAALSWMIAAVRYEIRDHEEIVKFERQAKSRREEGKGSGPSRTMMIAAEKGRERIERLRSALRKPHLAEAEANAKDAWYQAFGGGVNAEQLAAAVGKMESAETPGSAELQWMSYWSLGLERTAHLSGVSRAGPCVCHTRR